MLKTFSFVLLNHLQPVAERIACLEAGEAGDRRGLQHLAAVRFKVGSPRLNISYLVGQMRFAGLPINAIFCADMNLLIAKLHPQSAAPCQTVRLGDLWQSQNAAVKLTRLFFCAAWDGDLGMVEPHDPQTEFDIRFILKLALIDSLKEF